MIVPVGPNAHSVSDHTQTNWNGVVGRIELGGQPGVVGRPTGLYPDVASKSARVARSSSAMRWPREAHGSGLEPSRRLNTPSQAARACAEPLAAGRPRLPPRGAGGGRLSAGGGARLWDEFDPALYASHRRHRRHSDGKRYTAIGNRPRSACARCMSMAPSWRSTAARSSCAGRWNAASSR